MKNIKIQKKIWIPVLAGVLVLSYLYFNKENVTVKEEITANGEKVVQVHEERKETVESEFPFSMSENSVQQAIHNMSHQKVLSDQKWGALPLTPERVKRLIQVVEANRKEYVNADLYLNILSDWDKSNFDNVVQAHNAVWDLQGGNIGKAYGKASPEEEMKFIQDNFDIKQ